jgi:predicted regulator of Ras-like GTPase activity (Roadblock/LC7/MglB family)
MDTSIFAGILEEMVTSIPEALGAVFVDWEGEMVDEFSHPGHDLRLVGAQWAVAYFLARAALDKSHHLGPDELLLRFERQQVIVRRVTDDYLVVMALQQGANLGRALHLIQRAEQRLREEM